jgi:hypothetical protein
LFFKLMTDGHLRERRSTGEIRTEIDHHRAVGEHRIDRPGHHPPALGTA